MFSQLICGSVANFYSMLFGITYRLVKCYFPGLKMLGMGVQGLVCLSILLRFTLVSIFFCIFINKYF